MVDINPALAANRDAIAEFLAAAHGDHSRRGRVR